MNSAQRGLTKKSCSKPPFWWWTLWSLSWVRTELGGGQGFTISYPPVYSQFLWAHWTHTSGSTGQTEHLHIFDFKVCSDTWMDANLESGYVHFCKQQECNSKLSGSEPFDASCNPYDTCGNCHSLRGESVQAQPGAFWFFPQISPLQKQKNVHTQFY